MKNQSYIFLILIVLAGTSCEKKIDIEADKLALISFTTVEWDKYVLARDIEAMADYYTEDAVRIENDGQILSGKESIRNEFRNRMKNNTLIKLYNEAEDVWISDDLGVVRGKYSVSFIPVEGSDTISIMGVWVNVCKRQVDGSWKEVHTLVSQLPDSKE